MTIGYVGTYTTGTSEGIYSFHLDETTGKFLDVTLFAAVQDPKYITYENHTIFSIFSNSTGSGVIAFDKTGNRIDAIIFEDSTSCFLLYHDSYIYTANYHEGTVSKIAFNNNRFTFIKKLLIQEKGGCHQVIVHQDHLLVPSLLLDKVYVLSKDLDILDYLELPKGFGPRHGVISPDGCTFYLLGELSNQLCTFDFVSNRYQERTLLSILPNKKINQTGSAAIRMSQDHSTLIISTRLSNTISIVNIATSVPCVTKFFSSSGIHPRDILNIANDRYLLVANRESNSLISMKIEGDFSLEVIDSIEIPEGVSICMKGDL